MKRLFLGAILALTLSIPACQCSDKPEIGPVEEASTVLAAEPTFPLV